MFLRAFGGTVNPINLIVAFGLANVLAAIPITPGGLGVVEAALTSTLVGFGLARSTAAVGVLAYRFVQFWLPIPLGGLSYASLKLGPLGRRRRLEAMRTLAVETAQASEKRIWDPVTGEQVIVPADGPDSVKGRPGRRLNALLRSGALAADGVAREAAWLSARSFEASVASSPAA